MEKAPNADYNVCVSISNPMDKVQSVYFFYESDKVDRNL